MKRHTSSILLTALSAFAAFAITTPVLRAADHGDAPNASNNQEADIADVYFFLDPNNNDNVIVIGTVRGFIAAGENGNFGIFDSNVKYRFEFETDFVPPPAEPSSKRLVSDKFIEVTFDPRSADPGPAGKEVLQVTKAQTATVKFIGFKDGSGAKLKSFTAPTTPPSTGATAPAQVVTELGGAGTTGISFFAGMVDDPFFFDIPAFGAFITSVRNGAPDATVFNRGRDSFAGYNVMGIALSIPAAILKDSSSVVGCLFTTQKQVVQTPVKKTGLFKGSGAFKTVDRMATPAVNVALIPFNRKNEYNLATPKDDGKLTFAVDILKTLKALGTAETGIGDDGSFDPTMLGGTAKILADVAVSNGDYLRLQTDKAIAPNLGNSGGLGANGFPNGRRLTDDVVDIELSLIANGNPFDGIDLGDNVNGSDPAPQNAFPFLALPNQPQPTGTLDDKTRN